MATAVLPTLEEALNPAPRLRSKVEVVTPEIAARWLERNEANRIVHQGTVEKYARDMKSGSWLLTGDPIQFGASGRLLNGQHRLWACVEADTPFETMVIRGIQNEEAVMGVLDTGKKRTLGNALQIAGESDGNVLASIINLAWRYERSKVNEKRIYPTHEEGLLWLAENPEARDAALVARRVYRSTRAMVSAVGTAYLLNSRQDAEAAGLFWEKVETGEGLAGGDPILAYRRWVVGAVAKRDKPQTETWLAYNLKAMNQWREKRKIRVLQVKPGEPMPELWR